MFNRRFPRFATTGVVSHLPGTIIDSIWVIIDENLQGVFSLTDVLTFQLENRNGLLTIAFSNDQENVNMRVDLPFQYRDTYPNVLFAYDDGTRQTILLPQERTQNTSN